VLIFGGLALLVLLAACVNATNLILARGTSRQGELVVRQALGASRGRIIRQLLTENVLLAFVGLGGAWILANLVIGWLTTIPMAMDVPINLGLRVDGRVFGLAVLVTVFAGLLAGMWPAVVASQSNLQQRLREGSSRGGSGRRGQRTRSILVVGQVAASLIVLICAGLFAASARHAARIDLGFRAEQLFTIGVDAAPARYQPNAARRVFERAIQEVKQLPGVRSAAWANGVPLSRIGGEAEVYPDGAALSETKQGAISIFTAAVSPDLFQALEMPVVEGRAFTERDDSSSARVVILNRRAADLLWPGRPALGRFVRLAPDTAAVEVVGVTKTSRYVLIGESPRPFLYLPIAQRPAAMAYLYIRTAGDPSSLIAPVRRAVASIDKDLVLFDAHTMTDIKDNSPNGLLPFRIGSVLATAVGVLALVLTIVGLYGVIAFSVAQRTSEIGLRMALGADRWKVVGSILGQAGRLAGAGIAIGLVVALLLTRGLAGLLVGVSVTDLSTFAAVVIGLALVTLGSAYLPARRASRIDPVTALRAD